ncbi:CoA-binding protein [Undibacterium jejuense]|uniref:CoA-binding protein n=1 Tax=Undibacterium jejuense TaxID=1344949 RepID=A0A923HCL6_9BURK|nr:CoA-binding protein [Undibacterium jejuense]MBC3862057.1 CoA-binding protein [Undibacterium jejuense]
MADIADLLRKSKTIAVVGLSPKIHRASYSVAADMQAHGYRIIPINPREAGKMILSERCYADLAEAQQHHHIDIVDCFRSADDIPPIAQAAIQIGARCLWMQSGIVNIDAARSAHEAGLIVVMDRCLKIEHQRLLVNINTYTESQ